MAKKEVEKAAAPKAVNPDAVRIRPTNIANYVDGVSGSGKRTRINGDPVSLALNGLSLESVIEFAEAMTGDEAIGEKYTHLNVGQQRMNLGNRIRGAVAKANKENAGAGDGQLAKIAKSFDKTRAVLKPKAEQPAALKAAAAKTPAKAKKAA